MCNGHKGRWRGLVLIASSPHHCHCDCDIARTWTQLFPPPSHNTTQHFTTNFYMIIISRTLAIHRSNNNVIWLDGWQDMLMERRAAQLFLPFFKVVSLITFQQVRFDHIFLHIQDGTICTNRMVYFLLQYVLIWICYGFVSGLSRWTCALMHSLVRGTFASTFGLSTLAAQPPANTSRQQHPE